MNTRLLSFATLLAISSVATAETGGAEAPSQLGMVVPPPSASSDAANSANVISPVRANVSLTTNALLGFVNSEPVFAQDLFRPIDGQLRSLAATSRDLADFRSQARAAIQRQMQTYVRDKLVISAARASLTEEERRGLDVYMATQRSKLLSEHGGSQAFADEAFKAEGTTFEKKLEDLRTEMIVRIYLHRELYPKIVVTRQMVMDEYERTKHQQDAEIELFMITMRVTRWLHEPATDGKLGPVISHPTDAQIQHAEQVALKQGQDIVEQLRKGADFSRLVEDYSQDNRANYGGRIPNVKRGSLYPAIEDAAFALPANTVGEPLLIKDSDFRKEAVVILKVGQKKEARTIPFSEAQKDIYATLSNKQYKQLADEYMQKLAVGAAVEAVDTMTDVAVDVAVTRYATQ
ncbi:MAG TPA: peptidylprolyl isomerase [Phycisphaerae bacterium]|nr:peptidylprolyl isomerase [Phycisphaerae bacterium]